MIDTKALFAACWADELATRKSQSPSYEVGDYKVTGRAPAPYGKRTAAWFEDHGHEFVDKWIEWRKSTRWEIWETPEGKPAIELEINFLLPGDIPVKTFIDRVMVTPAGEPVVVDLKTGRLPETAEQLGLYRCAVLAQFGIDIHWGYWWDAGKGTHVGPYDLTRFTPGFFSVAYQEAVAGINAGYFAAKPANNCASWCSVADYCHSVGGSKALGVDPLAVP